jgi:hypothetical protein
MHRRQVLGTLACWRSGAYVMANAPQLPDTHRPNLPGGSARHLSCRDPRKVQPRGRPRAAQAARVERGVCGRRDGFGAADQHTPGVTKRQRHNRIRRGTHMAPSGDRRESSPRRGTRGPCCAPPERATADRPWKSLWFGAGLTLGDKPPGRRSTQEPPGPTSPARLLPEGTRQHPALHSRASRPSLHGLCPSQREFWNP